MSSQRGVDYNSFGFPSAEYIVYNLQSLAHYAQLNGGKVRVPTGVPIKKLPFVSMVVHVYNGFYEARIIPEEEYRAEKALEKGLVGNPVGEE